MKDRRLTNAILLALLIFNIGFIGSWWYNHYKMHKMMFQNHHFAAHESKAGNYLAKELGLTDEQQTQLEALRKAHFQKVEIMEMAIGRNEKNMLGLLTANPVDTARVSVYVDSIGMMKAAIQKELFTHFNNIKKICNPEQSRNFDRLIGDMSKEFPHHFETHHGGEAHNDSI